MDEGGGYYTLIGRWNNFECFFSLKEGEGERVIKGNEEVALTARLD